MDELIFRIAIVSKKLFCFISSSSIHAPLPNPTPYLMIFQHLRLIFLYEKFEHLSANILYEKKHLSAKVCHFVSILKSNQCAVTYLGLVHRYPLLSKALYKALSQVKFRFYIFSYLYKALSWVKFRFYIFSNLYKALLWVKFRFYIFCNFYKALSRVKFRFYIFSNLYEALSWVKFRFYVFSNLYEALLWVWI